MNVVRDGGRAAERLIDLLPVDVLRMGRRMNGSETGDSTHTPMPIRARIAVLIAMLLPRFLFFDLAAAADEAHFLAVLPRLRGGALAVCLMSLSCE